jgi:hypothetical protein
MGRAELTAAARQLQHAYQPVTQLSTQAARTFTPLLLSHHFQHPASEAHTLGPAFSFSLKYPYLEQAVLACLEQYFAPGSWQCYFWDEVHRLDPDQSAPWLPPAGGTAGGAPGASEPGLRPGGGGNHSEDSAAGGSEGYYYSEAEEGEFPGMAPAYAGVSEQVSERASGRRRELVEWLLAVAEPRDREGIDLLVPEPGLLAMLGRACDGFAQEVAAAGAARREERAAEAAACAAAGGAAAAEAPAGARAAEQEAARTMQGQGQGQGLPSAAPAPAFDSGDDEPATIGITASTTASAAAAPTSRHSTTSHPSSTAVPAAAQVPCPVPAPPAVPAAVPAAAQGRTALYDCWPEGSKHHRSSPRAHSSETMCQRRVLSHLLQLAFLWEARSLNQLVACTGGRLLGACSD